MLIVVYYNIYQASRLPEMIYSFIFSAVDENRILIKSSSGALRE